jgi:hypothetical protein
MKYLIGGLVATIIMLCWYIVDVAHQSEVILSHVIKVDARFDSLQRSIEYNLYGDYQITVNQDSIYYWDLQKCIGGQKLAYDSDALSTAILEDNE